MAGWNSNSSAEVNNMETYCVKVVITPDDIYEKLSPEDKQRFNRVIIADVSRDLEMNVELTCVAVNDQPVDVVHLDKMEKIKKIKEYTEPPMYPDDPYWHREPWQKFGVVSSGICMRWYWYRDEVIDAKTTNDEVDMAYNEVVNHTKPLEDCSKRLVRDWMKQHGFKTPGAIE